MSGRIASFAVELVAQKLGIGTTAFEEHNRDGRFWTIAPIDGHPNESFSVVFRPRWRAAEAEFVAGRFAGSLIAKMGESGPEGKTLFVAFFAAALRAGLRVVVRVNGFEVDAASPESWPVHWSSFALKLRRSSLVIDQGDEQQLAALVDDLVVPCFGMLSALIGVEHSDMLYLHGESEGDAHPMSGVRYERKQANREACIRLKGESCAVCGFNFGRVYGALGTGYIEVHHTVPVAQMGAGYSMDVVRDLEPLCANCHAMVHRQDPPMAVASLRESLASRGEAVD